MVLLFDHVGGPNYHALSTTHSSAVPLIKVSCCLYHPQPVACSHLRSALGFLSLKLGAPLWRPCKQNWARMQEIAHSSLPTSSNSQGPLSCHCSLVPGSTDLLASGSHSPGLASCLCHLVPSQLFNFTSSCLWQKTTTEATLVSQSTSSISLVMLSLRWNIPSPSFCLTKKPTLELSFPLQGCVGCLYSMLR